MNEPINKNYIKRRRIRTRRRKAGTTIAECKGTINNRTVEKCDETTTIGNPQSLHLLRYQIRLEKMAKQEMNQFQQKLKREMDTLIRKFNKEKRDMEYYISRSITYKSKTNTEIQHLQSEKESLKKDLNSVKDELKVCRHKLSLVKKDLEKFQQEMRSPSRTYRTSYSTNSSHHDTTTSIAKAPSKLVYTHPSEHWLSRTESKPQTYRSMRTSESVKEPSEESYHYSQVCHNDLETYRDNESNGSINNQSDCSEPHIQSDIESYRENDSIGSNNASSAHSDPYHWDFNYDNETSEGSESDPFDNPYESDSESNPYGYGSESDESDESYY